LTFRGFQRAYPSGTVFLNKPTGNPMLRFLDAVIDAVIDAVLCIFLAQHKREEASVIDNMTHFDKHLPSKTYAWGINVGSDAAYTERSTAACSASGAVVDS
jgi:hypothetical protein